jgi:glycine/D-amino acid oxidase-like deaminating enzyme/nitrite reductase/ring-hydroxylating ferredoxin subunit
LLERRRLAEIDTGHTTAHLTIVTDTPITDLVKTFGRDHAQAVWDAGFAAIDEIDGIVSEQQIDCDFGWVPGFLHTALAEPNAEELASLEEQASLARELGFDASFIQDVPFMHRAGVRFEGQARFHPRKYLAGLAEAVIAHGGRIYEHCEVEEFCDAPRFVKANGFKVACDHVIIATHNPLVGLAGLARATLLQTKLALFTSYAVAARVPTGKVPDAMWWDTDSPYRYLRVSPHQDHDLIIYGGEDHKTGQVEDTSACYDRLEKIVQRLVPGAEITHRWSGQVIETPDGLPYIGETAERQFVATGFAGNGMTFGTLGAMMAADNVLGRANPWSDLFSPDRKKLSAIWNYVKENKDYPYYMLRDRLAGGGASARAVRRGKGKVIEVDGKAVAAYRAPSGQLAMVSAVCTHMGCNVEWNDAERTWDCPCHGSRFGTDGQVISGPAETPLEKVEYEGRRLV